MLKLQSKHASCWNNRLGNLEVAPKKFYEFIISIFLMREVKIRLITFSVFQFVIENLDWGREVYHFMDLVRGTREMIQILCFSFACLSACNKKLHENLLGFCLILGFWVWVFNWGGLQPVVWGHLGFWVGALYFFPGIFFFCLCSVFSLPNV